jgi:hypothetical protein
MTNRFALGAPIQFGHGNLMSSVSTTTLLRYLTRSMAAGCHGFGE